MTIDYKGVLDNLTSTKSMWSSVASQIVTEQIGDIAILSRFYDLWASSGYDSAINDLKEEGEDGELGTGDDLGSYEEKDAYIQEKAKNYFGTDYVPPPSDATEAELETDISTLEEKIRYYYGQKSAAENMITATDQEIENVKFLQEADASLGSDESE